jgi:tRNA A-37 threonylcarbamoyl transferase component Bud32
VLGPALKEQEYVIKYTAAPQWIIDSFWLSSIGLGVLLAFACITQLQAEQMSAVGLFVFAVFLILAMLMLQNRIVLRPDGMYFPFHLLPGLMFRTKRRWQDIGAVMVVNKEGPDYFEDADYDSKELVIHFNSGGHVRLQMAAISMPDLDKFFQASKTWGSTAVFSPELIEMKRKLFTGPGPSQGKQLSLTTLWEEEMQQHFTTTNFVPLDRGKVLQGGRFKITTQLTAGGLSAIYLAEKTDKRTVVIKESVVPPQSDEATCQKAKEMFDREAKMLVKLNHPRIAKVYDHFVEDGRDYMILEYVPGQSFRQLITRDGPQLEDQVLDWAIDIVDVLHYLHTQDPPIIHRDVSPDNLLLREDGTVFMIDFGAANEFVGTATGTLVGKQAYIAPEQFRGKAQPVSDIYALGGTLFYLLVGGDPEALSVSHPATTRKIISSQVDALIAECTALDPSGRPADAAALREKILQVKASPRGGIIKVPGSSG